MKIIEIGSEFDWDSNLPFQKNQGEEYFTTSNLYKFRSGRDALKAVAKFYQNKTKKVLMPALCCESMVSPFTMNGYEVVFYKTNSDYTANVADVESKLENGCIFLYMPYFGINPVEYKRLNIWKERFKIITVEDRTQNALHKQQEKTFIADATVISIRKWLSIPDGGLLYTTKNFEANALEDTSFANIRLEAMMKKSQYLLNGDEQIKTSYRNMLQIAAEELDLSANFYAISSQSEKVLSQIDFEKILKLRQKNAIALKSLLNEVVQKGQIEYITQNPEDSTLYFPILVKERDSLQKTLAENKIYCPVIWPVPQEAQGVCDVAEYTAKHMLALPCDQRYDVKDMEYIANKIKEILN